MNGVVMRAQYIESGGINILLSAGEMLLSYVGPTLLNVPAAPGNSDYAALMSMVAAGTLVIEPYRSLDPTLDMGRTTAEIMGP